MEILIDEVKKVYEEAFIKNDVSWDERKEQGKAAVYKKWPIVRGVMGQKSELTSDERALQLSVMRAMRDVQYYYIDELNSDTDETQESESSSDDTLFELVKSWFVENETLSYQSLQFAFHVCSSVTTQKIYNVISRLRKSGWAIESKRKSGYTVTKRPDDNSEKIDLLEKRMQEMLEEIKRLKG